MPTTTWTGATSTDYYDPGNWMSGVPGKPDIATFAPGTGTNVTISIANADTTAGAVGAFQFTGGNYTITMPGTQVFVFTGAGVQVTGGRATIELINGAELHFNGSSDGGGTAAYVLDRQCSLDFNTINPSSAPPLSTSARSKATAPAPLASPAKHWSSVATIFPPLSQAPSTPAGRALSLRSGPAR
jgi:hypothetical protein